MKKTIALILCVIMMSVFSACGDNDKNAGDEKNSISTSDKAENSKSSNKSKDSENKSDAKTKSDAAAEGEASITQKSGEEIVDMVNEFNETDDPERKEELRKELEVILSQMEEVSSTEVSE